MGYKHLKIVIVDNFLNKEVLNDNSWKCVSEL